MATTSNKREWTPKQKKAIETRNKTIIPTALDMVCEIGSANELARSYNCWWEIISIEAYCCCKESILAPQFSARSTNSCGSSANKSEKLYWDPENGIILLMVINVWSLIAGKTKAWQIYSPKAGPNANETAKEAITVIEVQTDRTNPIFVLTAATNIKISNKKISKMYSIIHIVNSIK